MNASNYSRGVAAKLSVLALSAAALALLSGCPAQEGPHPSPHLERNSTPSNVASRQSSARPAAELAPPANKEPPGGRK